MDINQLDGILNNPANQVALLLLVVWSLIWKGVSLWKAARNGQRNWFVVMLILNTLGILEILYVFYFSVLRQTKKDKSAL